VDFLIYSRGAPAAAHRDNPKLDEQHWAYMDGFADRMTARGPTLATDRQRWTGSLHVIDLPTPEAAREFVAHEPYNQAGSFAKHSIWRFVNSLGRTMWQFEGAADEPRFLVLVHSAKDRLKDPGLMPLAQLPPELPERLIVYGVLRSVDDEQPAGLALAVQAPTREALDTLLADPRAGLADYDDVEIHDWEFGGRR
jgi:uncharacterized protein